FAKQYLGVSKDKHTFFGTVELKLKHSDHAYVIGIRNNTSKKMPASLAFGNRVFVCDNMAFIGDVVMHRKHTSGIMDDLPEMIDNGLSKFHEFRDQQDRMVKRMRKVPIKDDRRVHDLL